MVKTVHGIGFFPLQWIAKVSPHSLKMKFTKTTQRHKHMYRTSNRHHTTKYTHHKRNMVPTAFRVECKISQ